MASTNLTPLLTKGFRENIDVAQNMYKPTYKELFHELPSNSRYEMEQLWGGYTLPQPRLDGEAVAQSSFFPSFSKMYIMANYGLADVLPIELIDDDQYGLITKWVPSRAGMLARAFNTNKEILAANWFASQFNNSTSVPDSLDGTGLFSTSHPTAPGSPVLQSNVTSMDLSIAAMDLARYSMMLQVSPNNLDIVENKIAKLVINPKLGKIAKQIQKGDWEVNTANRNLNVLKNMFELVEWAYWTASGAASATAYDSWMVLGETNYLRWFTRQALQFNHQELMSVNSMYFVGHERFAFGHSGFYGTFAGTGS